MSLEKNLKYVKKEELKKLKQSLQDKICRDIKNKYGKLLSEKEIEQYK